MIGRKGMTPTNLVGMKGKMGKAVIGGKGQPGFAGYYEAKEMVAKKEGNKHGSLEKKR